ncbi:hypothetical protein PRIPAC_72282, partial [Pristionchus pacificus]
PWTHPSPFLDKKKHRVCTITSGTESRIASADQIANETVKMMSSEPRKLRGCAFVFIKHPEDVEKSLRSVLIAGAIPVLLHSSRDALPFLDLVASDDYTVFMEDFHGMGRVLRITTDRQFEMRR